MPIEEMAFQQEFEDTLSGRFLTFILGEEVFGIEIRYVTEIIGIQPIHRLPETAEYIKGIINLRGKIIPVVDMRLRFGKNETPYTDRTCIVVVETKHLAAGLIVDQVSEVMVIEESNIVPPPDVQPPDTRRYISGIGKVGTEVKLLIDCEKLFDINEMKSMEVIEGENL